MISESRCAFPSSARNALAARAAVRGAAVERVVTVLGGVGV